MRDLPDDINKIYIYELYIFEKIIVTVNDRKSRRITPTFGKFLQLKICLHLIQNSSNLKIH